MDRQQIHENMLSEISDQYDKRAGTFTFDMTKPAAIEIEKAYQKNEEISAKLDIENLSDSELAARIKERTGIERRIATFSIGTVEAAGNGTIYEGDLFETDDGIQFEATETVSVSGTGSIPIQALIAGEDGNVPANQIISMPVTLDNINSVTNPEPTYDGFEQESDMDLLQRYYDRIRTPATSGNRYQYMNWAKEVPGVGDVKVFPLWNGPNTVKVVIIDNNRVPASTEIVEEVQDYIDPGITGLGDGVASIGAYATVVSASGVDIDLSFTLTVNEGFTEQQALDEITDNVTDHLRDIAFQQDYVSYAQIGSIIINSNAVADYTNLTINSGTSNISVADDQVAVMGVINLV
ncbi:baseplate J/gp47 family protein [Bacillus sp. AK031]